jgi:D-alanyl-D-alanine carboxypeptidase (penicillin-binding protein 5/6)
VNKNRLLSSLNGCIGVKTGYTTKAGRCLVSAIERNNTVYVCVVLNCGPMFEESERLLNNADSEYENVKIVDRNREIFNEYIIDKQNGKLFLYAEEDFYYPLNNEEKNNVILKYNIHLDDAKENDCVGEIKVFLNNCLLKTIKLFTMNKIDKLIDSHTLEISEILWEEKINEN